MHQELSALYDYLLKVILTGPSAVGKSSLLYRLANPIAPDPTSAPSTLPTSPIPAAHPTQKPSATTSDLPYLPQTIGIDLHTHLITLGAPATAAPSSTPPKASTLSASYLAKRKAKQQPTQPPPRQTKIKLQLWDTAGTERFRAVGRAYYRASCAALVVYDVCSRASLRACEAFVRDIRVLAGDACTLVLVGNKVDVDEAGGADAALEGQAVREVMPEEADAFATRHGIALAVDVSARTGLGVEQLFRRVASMVLAKVELGEIDPGDVNSGVHYGDLDAWASGDDDGRTGSRAGGGLQMWGSAFGARRLGEQRSGCC